MRYKSNLFIPGHTLDRLDRGLNSNASALIIDLEDGCPEDKKIDERHAPAERTARGDAGGHDRLFLGVIAAADGLQCVEPIFR